MRRGLHEYEWSRQTSPSARSPVVMTQQPKIKRCKLVPNDDLNSQRHLYDAARKSAAVQ